MQQALVAGVSPEALTEVGKLVGNQQVAKVVPKEVKDTVELTSDEDELDAAGGAGSGDPMNTAVLQLARIVKDLHQDKLKKKDRLEAILDGADGGSLKDTGSSSSGRSHAAALKSLQQLLLQEVEKLMKEDWEQNAAAMPGVSSRPARSVPIPTPFAPAGLWPAHGTI